MSAVGSTEPLVLGRYQLGRHLGAGAAGSVFRAVDTRSGQPVVVKFFDGEEDGFPPWASEMRLVLRFQHANIVACLDTGFDESHRLWVLVFELAAGGSLRRALVAGRAFTARQTVRLLLDVGSALSYAHAQGVVHRDVKPENIVARAEGEDSPWLLTDFGAGRFLAPGQVARSLAGSVEYMAPEVLNQAATAVSDQFSLGVVGIELINGKRPSPAELPDLAESLRERAGLLGIIGRLAAQDPARRFAGMVEVVTALQEEQRAMKVGGDTVDLMRPYLREKQGLSEEALLLLVEEWHQQGSFLDFLVGKKLLPRAAARTLEAVSKGYLDISLETVLGLPEKTAAPAVAIAAAVDTPLPDVTADSASAGLAPVTAVLPEETPLPPAAPSMQTPSPAALVETVPVAVESREPTRLTTVAKPLAGLRLGRYILQEQLGEGGTATVFRSFHQTMNIPVAIKVFPPLDVIADPEAAARFRREAQTLASLEHHNIVRILDADIDGKFPYIVMEYVGEITLETQIATLGKLSAQRVSQIGIAVADALSAAWAAGLLHRDVKPSNILERRDGQIKLVDFGIVAQRLPEGGLSDPQAALGFVVSGTPLYIAPEQALRPDDIDFRADMYALGATLYHAVIGRPPLVRDTAQATMMAQIYDEPIPIGQLDPGFNSSLAAAIHRMLRKKPEERFGSWAEARAALIYISATAEESAVTPVRPQFFSAPLALPERSAAVAPSLPPAPLAAASPGLPAPPRFREATAPMLLLHWWVTQPQSQQLALKAGALLLFLLLLIVSWLGMQP